MIGVERKLAIEPVSFSRTTAIADMIAGIRQQHQHEDAGHHRVDAEKGLIVAKAGLDIVVRPGVGAARATRLALQFLALLSDDAGDVILRASRRGTSWRRRPSRRLPAC